MLTVISPAKTLDFNTPPMTDKVTQPDDLKRSQELVGLLRTQSPKQLSKLMGISQKLAELNAERFIQWKPPFNRDNARQAILAFKGDVYIGLAVSDYSARDFNFAQKHLRILSGLYGVLRPLDLIQPYRLEMGTKLATKRGKDLYDFWGDKVSKSLATELEAHRNKSLLNLASNEYFKAVKPTLLPGRVITPVFKDRHRGEYRVMSFFAKKARGYMASFIVKHRINKPEDIRAFDVDGYRFNQGFSNDDTWIFTR